MAVLVDHRGQIGPHYIVFVRRNLGSHLLAHRLGYLHVFQKKFQFGFLIFLSISTVVVRVDFRHFDLNSEGGIAQLLLSIDHRELLRRSLNSQLLNQGLCKLGHFNQFENEESSSDELDSLPNHTT